MHPADAEHKETPCLFAEGQAMRRIPMHMADWIKKLDNLGRWGNGGMEGGLDMKKTFYKVPADAWLFRNATVERGSNWQRWAGAQCARACSSFSSAR
ncbi:MAG TPA: hypothetical protein PLU38_07420 [Kiritimatiellia bacterium]|nr:hypothetical protein [Kiritimatiellia bacterium]HPO36729.1 hypothetical protein [Kiritimatiellia bacterium]HQL50816.1 hypothetical protein [Kiritimatiellia bacterium]HQQ91676.1 hypothetical protein [Kiritimatiellia bacterium]